jgi:D-alanyl-D-alanine carboxypeptidase
MAHFPPSVRYALFVFLGILILAGFGGTAWFGYQEHREARALASDLASTTDALGASERARREAEDRSASLESSLAAVRRENASFSGQISSLASTVGTLDKLAKTDPELLAKYSKVYFLNENYVPSALGVIDPEFVNERGKTIEFHAKALPYLERLIEDAEEDGVSLKVISGYRSFTTQAQLKSSYRVTYGSGANAFSADQGYSEHQLGTALDFTTAKLGSDFSNGFDRTDGFAWLEKHAYKYGFILSYPAKNAYYQYEPWHWRFVGVDLARRLHDEGKNFYDLDQRAIDEYLVSLFD